jgi:chemotaxis response regulator CheB
MHRIRTVTISITPLLSDIISQVVAEHAPIDIVARLGRSERLAQSLQMLAPNLVLIGLCQSEGDAIALSLCDALPWAKVIALSHDARHAYLPVPHRHRSALIEMSPNALIEAIRGF